MKLLRILALIFTFSLGCFAAEKSISSYPLLATPNDGLDDSAGFQRALDDLAEAGGGMLKVTDGVWNIDTRIRFVTYTQVNNSFIIKGTKGAIIKPHLSSSEILFYPGNQNQLTFQDLIFIGDAEHNPDLGYLLYASYVAQLRIIGCQFFGIEAAQSIIYAGTNTDLVIKDCLFNGLASGVANVQVENSRGLTVSDTDFFDYGHFNDVYYSKTGNGVGSWIKATATSAIANAGGQRALKISNVRFDEGAGYALDADGITYIQIDGIMVNICGGGAGLNLNNVKYAEVKMSKFGYTNFPTPAIRAFNNTTVYLDGVTIGDAVFYGERDQGSRAFFNLKACSSGCAFNVLPVAKARTS